MSPIQPSKRRRLNTATNTLSQPFKSPLKTPFKPKSDPAPSPTKEAPSSPPTSSPPTKTDNDDPAIHPTSPPPLPRPALAPTNSTTPLRRTLLPHHHHHSPSSSSSIPSHQHLALQKQHTRLLNHLSAARAALETSTQALKIESSSRDAELEVLILKWRSASRAAAEEVFERARDKVNRMGGVGAMRERERERCGRVGLSYGWDEAAKVKSEDGDGDGGEGFSRDGKGGEEDGTGYDNRIREAEEVDEREDGVMKRADEAWGNDDDAGYTMDMMLRSLNVELGVIGFDPGLQKWVD